MPVCQCPRRQCRPRRGEFYCPTQHPNTGAGSRGVWSRRRRHVRSCRVGLSGRGLLGTPERAVDGGAGDREQLLELADGVTAGAVQLDQVGFLPGETLGRLPRSRPLAQATFMPLRVRMRARSALNSATMAKTLNSSRPTGSVGSCNEPPRLSRIWGVVSSSAMARASGRERARRSSLVTTRVSPARQAVSAWRSPGRSRLVPVRPWST